MNDLILQAENALYRKNGQEALEITDRILEQDERNSQAWFLAMQCFQFLVPIEQYNAENELSCAKYAIRFAEKGQKYRMKKQVYGFLLDKILAVLKRDSDVLSDCREILGFYQRTVYFDAIGAANKAHIQDQPVLDAVEKTFNYCEALFEFIPDSAIRGNRELDRKAQEIAEEWRKMMNLMAMRLGMFHYELSTDQKENAEKTYNRYIKAIRDRETMLQTPFFLDADKRQ